MKHTLITVLLLAGLFLASATPSDVDDQSLLTPINVNTLKKRLGCGVQRIVLQAMESVGTIDQEMRPRLEYSYYCKLIA